MGASIEMRDIMYHIHMEPRSHRPNVQAVCYIILFAIFIILKNITRLYYINLYKVRTIHKHQYETA